MRFSIILAVFLLLSASSFGQRKEIQRVISAPELKQDVAALRKALEKHHPGIYWYTTKQEFDHTWDSLNQQLNVSLSEIEFFKKLLPVVAKVKCAHTLFYPSNSIIAKGSRFPIDIKLIRGEIYLMPDSSNRYQIPNGSKLISINNRPTEIILKELLPCLQAQGGNPGWKKVILENDFQNYYYYVIEQVDQFMIRYLDQETNQEESIIVNGSDEEIWRKHWKNWYPANDGPPLTIKYVPDSQTAIVTIKSLVRSRAKMYHQDFDELLAQYFKEIKDKGIQKLIIDVRGNEGGNNPELVYSYIAKQGDDSHGDRKDKVSITPAKNSFAGQVIVLANERSISALESFVSIFKYYERGSIVGRATPGCVKGLCGGKKHKLILPNSKFEILIPMHASKGILDDQANAMVGQGYFPDLYVEESIEDTIEGNDEVMKVALGLSRKN